MKLKNIKEVEEFRKVIHACAGDVYLKSQDGDVFNLKSALSEYIGLCVTDDAVTLLDINNTVPAYIYDEDIKGKYGYKLSDTFMGFHCGNTPECKLCACLLYTSPSPRD